MRFHDIAEGFTTLDKASQYPLGISSGTAPCLLFGCGLGRNLLTITLRKKSRPQKTMKRISLLLVVLNALLTSAVFAVNDVGSFYAVLKQQRYSQSSTLPPTLSGSQPYRFSSIISRASGGTLISGTVTPPNTGTVNTPQPYAPNNDGTG